jgi:predicted double-glycine peptidase
LRQGFVALLTVALAGSSGPAMPAEGPVRSLLEIRREGVIVQEWDTSCGAAALATVLTYAFADPVAEKAVAQAMLRRTDPLRVRVRGGFSLLDMKRFAESRGYSATGYRGLSLEELLAMRSPIVPIEEYGNPHFIVVRGRAGDELDVADPAFGNRRMSAARFRAVWKDGIGFVLARSGS